MSVTDCVASDGSACPVPHGRNSGSDRRVTPTTKRGPAVERVQGGWIVRSAPVARELLRDGGTRQAGFAGDIISTNIGGNLPLLYNYGEAHRKQRSNVARFFTPKTVDARYRELMNREIAKVLDAVSTGQPVVVDDLSMQYSVAVAREVVGLTNSTVSGLAWRLNTFFGSDTMPSRGWRGRLFQLVGVSKLSLFHIWDVRPAIAERRRTPRNDVISYLIGEGLTDSEILTEAIAYAAAGMVTTREFISVALLHLLRNDPLRQRYLVAEQAERYAILHELLRLEPIVTALHRRMKEDVTITHDGVTYTFAAGEKVTVSIRESNTDEAVTGECPMRLIPGRDLAKGFKDDVLGFGEGPHRCPGSFLATQETDMLLLALLDLPLKIVAEPDVTTDALLEAVALRGLMVQLQK